MPRFVLLRHTLPEPRSAESHWDLMLEHGGALLTWRLTELPSSWLASLGAEPSGEGGAETVDAVRLADHRLEYLGYEGPVSNNRGEVARCDGGTYRTAVNFGNTVAVLLEGALLQGRAALSRQAGDRWRLEAAPVQR